MADLKRVEFLISGMCFLVLTSLSGILILFSLHDKQKLNFLLQFHGYLSLYGWNLTGLIIMIRKDLFPVKLHHIEVILSHWAIVALLAPLATIYATAAFIVIPSFCIFLFYVLFGYGHSPVTTGKKHIPRIHLFFNTKLRED